MGSDFVLFIDLKFPSPVYAREFKSVILNEHERKFKEPFAGEFEVRPIADVLKEWKSTGAFKLSVNLEKWTLAGIFGEDAFIDLAPEFAALMVCAEKEGASGEAAACSIEWSDGYMLALSKQNGLKIRRLKEIEAEEMREQDWYIKAVTGA